MRIHEPRPCLHCGTIYKPRRNDRIKYCSQACYRAYELQYKKDHAADLFWARVRKTDDCWIWQGGIDSDGDYGYFDLNKKRTRAHRFAYQLTHGSIPEEREVCHTCDNPRCVRPDHLFLGTTQDNRDDCAAKGRLAFKVGSRIVYSGKKISDKQVVEILMRARAGGITQQELAEEYGVSRPFVSEIISGKVRKSATREHFPLRV